MNKKQLIDFGKFLGDRKYLDVSYIKTKTDEYLKILPDEYILCSAIKYDGITVPGLRHGDCYNTILKLKGEFETPGEENIGYLTSKGRFVDRHEGYLIAREYNQIVIGRTDETTSVLISENLY